MPVSRTAAHVNLHLIRWILLLASGACTRTPKPATQPPVVQPPPAAQPAPRIDSTLPTFEIALWPGEGIPVIVAAVERLELRERPYEWARVVATLQVRQGDTLRYDATRYQTITPATVRVLRADSIEGRNLGRIRLLTRDAYYSDRHPRTATAVQAASTFEFLQHRAEGSCFVRVGGSVLDADVCPIHDDAAFRSSGEPVTRWWIRVAEPGRPPGWTRVGAAAREVGRTF